MVSTPDVVVIGAGVVGLSTALHLGHAGLDVEIVDAVGPGGGTSRTNAGWLVPSMSEPVPSPAALRTALRWAMRRDSPLKIGMEASPAYLAFLGRMLLSSRREVFQRGLAATADLAAGAIDAFDDLDSLGVRYERHTVGVLQLYLSEAAMESHRRDHQTMARYGLPAAESLDAAEVRGLEPAVGSAVVGGLLTTGDQHVDPSSLIDGLTAACRASGIRIRCGDPVHDLNDHGNHLSLTAGSARIRTRRLVIAAGVGTRHLTHQLGVDVPVRAGKGYGFDFRGSTARFRHSLYLSDHKVAVTPLSWGTRVAGTMEFGAENTRIDHSRASAVARAIAAYVPSWADPTPVPWAGLRPMTPDGLPLIGPLPGHPNVTIASGHAMLGVTLGPLTGQLVSRSIAGHQPPDLIAPFDPARFSSHGHRPRRLPLMPR